MIIIVTKKDKYFGVLESDIEGSEWTKELRDDFLAKVESIKESIKSTGKLPIGMKWASETIHNQSK